MERYLLDRDRAIETIHHLPQGMRMVPIGSILGGLPPIGPIATGLNGLLGQSRNSIGPWGIELLDSVEMNGCIKWKVIVNSDLLTVSTRHWR